MKAHIFRNVLIAMTLTLMLGACKKDELIRFDAEPDIYFVEPRNYADRSLSVKFNFLQEDSAIYFTTVATTGGVVDYDRPINVVAMPLPESDTVNREAKPDIHYEIIPAVIPAGEVYGRVRVKLKRAISAEDKKEVKLVLKLLQNEHFNTSFDSIINNASERKKRTIIEFPIYISDALTAPPMWKETYVLNLLGPYTEAKYRLLCSDVISGYPPAFWEGIAAFNGKMMTPGDWPPMAERMRLYIYQRFVEIIPGGKVFDDDGLPMEIPGWRNLFTAE